MGRSRHDVNEDAPPGPPADPPKAIPEAGGTDRDGVGSIGSIEQVHLLSGGRRRTDGSQCQGGGVVQ